jgi:hypothetical protein
LSICQLHVQACLLAEGDALGQALHQAGDADLIDHLGELTGARRADARHCLGHGHCHRLNDIERRLIAAAHHRQCAVDGAGLTAGDRRVDEVQAACKRSRMQLTRDGCRRRGVIDEDRLTAHPDKRAVIAERNRAQVVVVADTCKDDRCAGGRFARRGCGP